MNNNNKTIIIYDADSIAYRAAAGVETRSIEATHIKTGAKRKFKNKTELKEKVILKQGKFTPTDFLIVELQEALAFSRCAGILDNQIRKINELFFADEYLLCLSGKLNMRDALPLPTKYKGSRTDLMRPIHLKAAKMHLWKNHPSLLANNREADDDVIIKGYEYIAKGYTVIIVSQDKDAFAYSGLTLYDYTLETPTLRVIPEFGSLHLEIKTSGKDETKISKVRGEGFIWYCFQHLLGDHTDDYKPCQLANVKFGEKSAYALLHQCTTEQEALGVVIQQYKEWYPEEFTYTDWEGNEHTSDYKQMLSLYFRCARMMTTETDSLSFKDFCTQRGIEL